MEGIGAQIVYLINIGIIAGKRACIHDRQILVFHIDIIRRFARFYKYVSECSRSQLYLVASLDLFSKESVLSGQRFLSALSVLDARGCLYAFKNKLSEAFPPEIIQISVPYFLDGNILEFSV